MTPEPPTISMDATATLRRSVYWLLILIAFGKISGEIAGVETVYEPRISWPKEKPTSQATHGANDRSRWDTVRALVEQNTYVIGMRVYFDEAGTTYEDQGIAFENGWRTIDKVLKPEVGWRNERPQRGEPVFARFYYSSKPPLLATVLAGESWLLHRAVGWSLTDEGRWWVVRITLFSVNAVPWLIALVLIARLADRLGTSDFGRIAAVAAACFCTFLSTFAVTLNNHTVAAWAIVFALYPIVKARLRQQPVGFLAALFSGFWAGWAATNELPALAFVGMLGLWVMRRGFSKVVPFAAGALIPIAGLLFTNYLAIGTVVPAYEKFGTEWYQYPGSYWTPEKMVGIDVPKDSTLVYLFHLTFGHHGLFSLTPVLLIALAGLVCPWLGEPNTISQRRVRTVLGYGTLFLTLVVLGFYLTKTESYNYGGWTSGPRWFFWLTPLWLLGALPALDALTRAAWGRAIILLALAWSAFSVAFPVYNPWRHPWLFRLLDHFEWIHY